MIKKDFVALADTLKAFFETNAGREMDDTTRGILTQYLAQFCKEQNSAFMRDRWLDYIAGKCGKNGGAVKATLPTCKECGATWGPSHNCAA